MNPAEVTVAFLEASLIRPLILVVLAWLILRRLRVRHPASRHAVWTAVLVGMLALPFVSVMTPDWTLPVLPWSPAASARVPAIDSAITPETESIEGASSAVVLNAKPSMASPSAFTRPRFASLIAWCYLVGLLAMLSYRLAGWLLLRRVISRSKSLRPTCLRQSDDVVTPVAVGVLRPSVILPAGWRDWSARTKRVVFAHEFAHLRRRDTLVAALARLVQCVYWFHPVAWWVSRQTSDLAELACDAVALQRVGDPAGYSRVLVQFASAVNRSGHRVALPGLAIASGSRMGERIDQVFEMSGGTMRRLARPIVWLLWIGLPALSLAATVTLGASAGAGSTHGAAIPQKFAVASIKPCLAGPPPPTGQGGRAAGPGSATTSPGRVHWECVTLGELIGTAYAGPDNRLLHSRTGQRPGDPKPVRGGPSWVDSEKFAIEASASGDVDRATMIGPMLRALLEDRFQLKTHRETEERSMYALTVAKGGLKIKQTTPGDCNDDADKNRAQQAFDNGGLRPCGILNMAWNGGNRQLMLTGVTLQHVAEGFLSDLVMDRFVIDQTALEGKFNVLFEFAPDDSTPGGAAALRWARRAGAEPPTAPAIFTALEEQLGLKLVATKARAEYLVIDSVQRPKPNWP
jgi:bla regulator protein blaR1